MVLGAVSSRLQEGERVAVVGRNGAGKSTLLKAAAGLLPVDGGTISLGRGESVGYLAQEHEVGEGRSLWDEVRAVQAPLMALETRAQRMHDEASALPVDDPRHDSLLHEADSVLERFRASGGYEADATLGRVLMGLGFAKEDWGRAAGAFSGGWQIRIGLARLLLERPTWLLLDEPTNHLDIETRTWLLHELQEWPGGVAVISHDRDFLDRLVKRTILVEDGKLDGCSGGYTAWLIWKEERERLRDVKAERLAEERAHIQGFVDRFRYKASKAAQVQSRIKMLDRMETVSALQKKKDVRLRFPDPPPCGEPVIEIRGLGKRFGEKVVLRGLELSVLRGDRVLLVGRNGAGKSTLLRLLAGEESPTEGHVGPGPGVRMAWFAQDQSKELPAEKTVLQGMMGTEALLTAEKVRSYLGAFLFSGDDVHKLIGILSGGEKSRVALARILLRRANLLLLDEPTNHLDIETKEVLADALAEYGGSLVFVSHDRAFANALATVVWEVGGGNVRVWRGNLDDFLWNKAIAAGLVSRRAPGESAPDAWLLGALPDGPPVAKTVVAKAVVPKAVEAKVDLVGWKEKKEKTREDDRRKKRIDAAMAQVEAAESNLQKKDAEIASPEVAADWERLSRLLAERDRLEDVLDAAQRVWEAAEAAP